MQLTKNRFNTDLGETFSKRKILLFCHFSANANTKVSNTESLKQNKIDITTEKSNDHNVFITRRDTKAD